MNKIFFNFLLLLLFAGPKATGQSIQATNIALNKPVAANSENPGYPAKNAVDGAVTRHSKWMPGVSKPPHILEIDLQKYCNISGIVVHTGIPEAEQTPAEKNQAGGFWSAKNFKLQYWDDANWTDIPNTEVHENRLTTVPFSFSPEINTFKIRLVSDDGEPVSIMEIEVFGTETSRNPAGGSESNLQKNTERTADQEISLSVSNKEVGKSMKYVGYNQGYYLPGSNVSGWIEYSGVNSLRIWTALNTYVPVNAVQVDDGISDAAEFDKRKAALRQNPENNPFIQWEKLLPIYDSAQVRGNTNPMVLSYVLSELNRLKIDPVMQINSTDFNDSWSNKWQQWQRYYALAFYAAKTGDVTMFSTQNEPNHRASGPMKLEQWIGAMQIVSDALNSAIEDVNKIYGKNLKAKMLGPVTAGNNAEWWAAIAKNLRTDYRGNKVSEDLLGIFSTHSYNSPASGYETRVSNIREIIVENHPEGKALPIVYTEIGRWMNAYLIDKEETMDSPSLFTEWAGIYTNNTKNSAWGMWAFKFSNTTSEVYKSGVKSGHHYTWQGKRIVEDAYTNLAAGKPVKTSNKSAVNMAGRITDGDKSDQSAWLSDSTNTQKVIEIDLEAEMHLGSAVIYTGSAGGLYTAPDRVRSFSLQYFLNNEWHDLPGFREKENKYAQVFRTFEEPITTSGIRYISDDPGIIKVREIKVFAYGDGPDEDEMNYDISGIQRTGQVVRLFAKGFRDERPLYETTKSEKDDNLDALTSYDKNTGNYYLWLVQRGGYTNHMNIDLSALDISTGSPITVEMVNHDFYGEVTHLAATPASRQFSFGLPPQSVALLTIPKAGSSKTTINAIADATVSGGKNDNENYGKEEQLRVSLDASQPENNKVAYIHFDIPQKPAVEIQRAILSVSGCTDIGTRPFRLHVYGIPSEKWKENELNWTNAPMLDSREALIKKVGTEAFVAGEMAFGKEPREHMLDVTNILRNHSTNGITFVLVRETRQSGDDEDKGREVIIHSKESGNIPRLHLWHRSTLIENASEETGNQPGKPEIYLLIGQSNMAGRAEIETQDLDSLDNVLLYTGISGKEWEKAANPLNKYSTVRKELSMQKLGPGYTFAREMAKHAAGKQIGLVVNAKGGTSIDEWKPGGALYNEAVKRAKAAMKSGTLKGIVWHQGESDVSRSAEYPAKLTELIRMLRNDLGISGLPFVAGQLSEDRPERKVFNDMIIDLPLWLPNTGVVSIEGTSTFDGTHFNSASQRLMGERFAAEMLKLIQK